MNAVPRVALLGGESLVASMILLIAIAFVVVVWAMASRSERTHQATKTKDETQ